MDIEKLLVIVPTYNESLNIERLVSEVFPVIPGTAGILVVDDNSPDGTGAIVQKMIPGSRGRLALLCRENKEGLGKAYLAGFEWGISRNYTVFLEMDADLSHNPIYIPLMLEKIKTHGAVIGSRYVRGGGVQNWSFFRFLISRGGSLYGRVVLRCPVKDLTGGFNMWRKDALDKINLRSIMSSGFLFQVEMKYKAYRGKCDIVEIPIVFIDRKYGQSKMSGKIFFEALVNMWNLSPYAEILKFMITGGLGAFTILVFFFLFVDILAFPPVPVSVGMFFAASVQSYLLHHYWTFCSGRNGRKAAFFKWAQYAAGSLAGLAFNISVMSLTLWFFHPPYKVIAQAAGILAGMGINFVFSKFVVWRKA
jgi:dolichol-phosphate mannosyltransferase